MLAYCILLLLFKPSHPIVALYFAFRCVGTGEYTDAQNGGCWKERTAAFTSSAQTSEPHVRVVVLVLVMVKVVMKMRVLKVVVHAHRCRADDQGTAF